MRPSTGLGISDSTLSVEISRRIASSSITSPGRLCHLVMVPVVIDSPIWGMTTSTFAIYRLLIYLQVKCSALRRHHGLAQELAEGRVWMDGGEDFFVDAFHRAEENVFVNQFSGVSANDVGPQQLTVLAGEDLDKAIAFV